MKILTDILETWHADRKWIKLYTSGLKVVHFELWFQISASIYLFIYLGLNITKKKRFLICDIIIIGYSFRLLFRDENN